MPFVSSIGKLAERVPWLNRYWNTHQQDVETAMSNLTASDFADGTLDLDSSQDIDGNDNSLWGFRRYLGTGTTSNCVIDVTSYGSMTVAGAYEFIQNAIDDLPDEGGCIMFPPGTYRIENSIYAAGSNDDKSNVTLLGFGNSTYIYSQSTTRNEPVFRLGKRSGQSNGMQIIGMRIDGGSLSGSYQAGVSLDGSRGAKVHGVTFEDIDGSGIHIRGSQDADIAYCRFDGMDDGDSGEGYGIYHAGTLGDVNRADETIGLKVYGCHFVDCDSDGIRLAATTNAQITNCTFDACGVSDTTASGIRIETLSTASVKNVMVRNCTFIRNRLCGIDVAASHAGNAITGLVFSGNTFQKDSLTQYGIRIVGADGSPIRAFTISGNTALEHSIDGIHIGAACSYGSISANTCCDNANNGITVEGIEDVWAELITLTANACGNNAGSAQLYGIEMGTYSRNCVVLGCPLDNNATANLLDSGTDNDTSHNPGA